MDAISPEQIRWIFQGMIVLILSIAVHEFGHAFVAVRLGDQLPRQQGRLTLNPVAHADPIGTLLLPFLGMALAIPVFGWGKPVQVRPERFSRRFSMLTGHMMVALAGPMMNVLLGTLIAAIHVTLIAFGVLPADHEIHRGLMFAALLNFTLFFFNMLPTPPLDGGTVARRVIPVGWRADFEKVAVYGPFLLLAVLMIPAIGKIITVPARFVTDGVYRGFFALAGL